MSEIKLHRRFIEDLNGLKDGTHFRQIILAVLDQISGEHNNKNDHRYKGVKDAWIRYVSRGNTALRIVYFQREEGIIFYRGGTHDIEDSVSKPSLTVNDLVDIDSLETEVSDEEDLKGVPYWKTLPDPLPLWDMASQSAVAKEH